MRRSCFSLPFPLSPTNKIPPQYRFITEYLDDLSATAYSDSALTKPLLTISEMVEANGGKRVGEIEALTDTDRYAYFADSEGNIVGLFDTTE